MPLDQWLRRQVWRRPILVLIIALAAGLIAWAQYAGVLPTPPSAVQQATYHGRTFLVTRVVDGDTLIVQAPDSDDTVRVRLWGIDTPERAMPDPENPGRMLPAEPFAEEATQRARELCEGKQVRLLIESHRVRDRYDRLLAHVELPDGTLLAEVLLLEGLARADDRWPHSRLERFAMIEQQARRSRTGLWATVP